MNSPRFILTKDGRPQRLTHPPADCSVGEATPFQSRSGAEASMMLNFSTDDWERVAVLDLSAQNDQQPVRPQPADPLSARWCLIANGMVIHREWLGSILDEARELFQGQGEVTQVIIQRLPQNQP